MHSAPQAGHSGINATVDKITQRFYWKGLKDDVKVYVSDASTNPLQVDAGEHWMLVVANTQSRQVCVLNSLTSTKYDTAASTFIDGWK